MKYWFVFLALVFIACSAEEQKYLSESSSNLDVIDTIVVESELVEGVTDGIVEDQNIDPGDSIAKNQPSIESNELVEEQQKPDQVEDMELEPKSVEGVPDGIVENQNIDYEIIADNASGFLMQNNMVDAVIVGADRITSSGDVCNKIGTYLKALAAKENDIPFYAALPSSTIDWNIQNGLNDIPIEDRSSEEIDYINGLDSDGVLKTIRLYPEEIKSFNPAFDVTPSKFITGIITEKGIFNPNEKTLRKAFDKL